MTTLFNVIVCAAIYDQQGRVLLARRNKDKKLGGFWEFPGGKLEHGEDLEQALKRELTEELAISVSNISLVHVKPYQYEHGAVLILFYRCLHVDGQPVLKDHDQIEWLNHQELTCKTGLLPANQEIISLLTQQDKKMETT